MELKGGPIQNQLDAKAAHFRPTNVFYYHLHLNTVLAQTTVRTIDTTHEMRQTTMEDLKIAE